MTLHAKVVSAYSQKDFNDEMLHALKIIQIDNDIQYMKYSAAVVRPGDNEIFYSALIVYTDKATYLNSTIKKPIV